VTEPLFIEPSLAYISPASDLQFLLETRVMDAQQPEQDSVGSSADDNSQDSNSRSFGSQGSAQTSGSSTAPGRRVIPMPSSQYKWSVSNITVLSIDKELGLSSGKVFGSSKVLLLADTPKSFACDSFQVTVTELNQPNHTKKTSVFVTHPVRNQARPVQTEPTAVRVFFFLVFPVYCLCFTSFCFL